GWPVPLLLVSPSHFTDATRTERGRDSHGDLELSSTPDSVQWWPGVWLPRPLRLPRLFPTGCVSWAGFVLLYF
uniref:Uncharacterized protein n=1 Tax=Aegilops tauschii subsp. strangulata TaxID=200361 RepID=A0A453D215_AEGTS